MSQQVLEKPGTMPDIGKNMAIAIYSTHTEAETAVRALQSSGFDMKELSIVGKDYHTEERVVGYYTTGDRMKSWGKLGAFWGGIWGLLFGSALFVIPGLGPIVMAGPVIGWIVAALEGSVVIGGLSALGAALVSLGIPKNSALAFETEIGAGKFLLIVHGMPEEVARARTLLEQTNHQGVAVHTA
jgi:hypothetical protein